MGSACSCTKSDEPSTPLEGQSPLKETVDSIITQNGHVPTTNGDILHINNIDVTIREAKELVSEAKTRTSIGSVNAEQDLISTKMASEMASLMSRLEMAVNKLEGLGPVTASNGPPPPQSGPQEEVTSVPFVIAYDELMSGVLQVFLNCSKQIGGDVAAIAKTVDDAFKTQRAFLLAASKSKQPSDADLGKVLEPTGKKIQEIIGFRESHRTSPLFNHLSAVSESIPGLSWVAVTPAPGPYLKDMGEAATFYTNRVLKDFKDKDKTHVVWTQNWNNVFKELQVYIKTHHTTGVSWNSRGGSIVSNLKQSLGGGAGVPPPPPPGVPPPPPMVKLDTKQVVDDGRNALFDQINKGTDITTTLKKVSDNMKTHKNPSLREGSKPIQTSSESSKVEISNIRPVAVKPPRMSLEGKKWFVEYQKNASNIVLENCRMEHSIYIFKCENTVVQVKGKVNSVILDSCKKTSVVFDALVSGCEIVNCQSCKIQVMEFVPMVSIEKTDGCQVYLSPASTSKVEIITAKSSEMNIMIPKGDGDFAECPVPEQFKTLINGLKLSTSITEKAG